MKHLFLLSTISFYLLTSLNAFAQLQISFPLSRAVYQRNTANNAIINISGTYSVANVSRVEARVVARAPGQGNTLDWQVIANNPQGGVFSGPLTVQAGWYDLDVRLIRDGQEVSLRRVERVGVGEVFVVAGQSNAGNTLVQGRVIGASAQDDRVNCVDYLYDGKSYPADPPVPEFTHIDNPKSIAPRGIGPWCWGTLGDLLARRLNVPVLFFNASYQGTSAKNWYETAIGDRSQSLYDPSQFYETKHPYYPLQLALQFYANTLGVRAVLWHQGEAENLFKHSTAQYIQWMQTVINQSRTDYGRNIAWVVARASWADWLGAYPPVIAGQDQVIATVPNVFAGPNTDNIQIPREKSAFDDGVHFNSEGLLQVADAWNASLTNDFFNRAQPIAPAPAPTFTVGCPGGNNVSLTVTNYDNITWTNGTRGRSVTVPAGTAVRATIRDSRGNAVFSPTIAIPNAPAIQAIGETTFCQGGSLALSSSFGQDNIWNTGQTSQRITATTSGDYQVRYNDASGCTFTSNVIRVTVNSIPATPTLTNEKPTVFCQGDNTVLLASSPTATRYNWSDGQSGQRATITQSGNYSLTVTDANGCTSAPSSVVAVTVNPVPASPQLTISGRTTFCANESVTLTSSEATAYQWSSGQTSRSITTNQSGTYQVRARNQFNCLSAPSNSVNVTAFPLPAQPIITNQRPTTFCQGESTVLTANSPTATTYNWNSGQTGPQLTISQTGSFSLTVTDANGCTSIPSAVVDVVSNPLPATPQLTASGRTTFCADQSVTLTSSADAAYQWSSGQNTRAITVNQSGAYQVRTRNQFNCISAPSNLINVTVNPLPPSPTISARGSLTFCEGNQLVLQSDSPLRTIWSSGDSTQTLTVRQTGTFTARVRDANGCLSVNSNSLTTRTLARPAQPTVRQIGTYLLEASGGPANERYYWRRDADSLTFVGAQLRINRSGQYSVRSQITYSPSFVCFSLPSTVFDYTLPTGNQGVSVYPNPNPDGLFFLETLEDLTGATVTVFTLAGQRVFTGKVALLNFRQQMDLRTLMPGTYLVNLTANGINVSKRIQILGY